jgi:hypothetical protein
MTKVFYKTTNPRFSHTFDFKQLKKESLQQAVVLLSVWHYDCLVSDIFLGEVVILLDKFPHYSATQRQPMTVQWMLLKRPVEPINGPFATLRSRYMSDPEARLLLQQRCDAVGWTTSTAMAAEYQPMLLLKACHGPQSVLTETWNSAVIRLTGRKTQVLASVPTINQLADASTPFTPFVAGLYMRRPSSLLASITDYRDD